MVCFLIVSQLPLAAHARKPNILWITIEDTSPQFIGCYGNPAARTPAIDRIANEGVRFTNAFSNGTVCSPSRSAIITGCRTNTLGTGHHRSAYPIPGYIKGFPVYLRNAGYYTSNNSKTDYNTSGAGRLVRESWDESSPRAGWWNRKAGQPFFSVFNFIDSHQSRTMTNPWNVYETQVLDRLDGDQRIDPGDIKIPPFLRDTPQMRREYSRIYNALALTDMRIDSLLGRLESEGLMDSTIIFFFADHGQGMPRGKCNSIGLGYRVPWAIWFPGMYTHLSPWGTGTVTGELVNFIDLAPTVLSLAGVKIPAYMSGRALMGEQRSMAGDFLYLSNDRTGESPNMERSVTDGRYIYTRSYMPWLPEHRWQKYPDYAEICRIMVRDYRAGKLDPVQQRTFQPGSAEYLYDLQNDPWEINNLADNPACGNKLRRFRKALDGTLINIRDVHFLPEYELDSISRYTTPCEYRLDRDNYPFEKIFTMASLSGTGTKAIKKLLRNLNHPDGRVRYWAAVGLRSQSTGFEKYRDRILNALDDDYPPARIIIAGICHNAFNDPAARDYLAQTCKDENPHLALLALQTILYLDDDRSRSYLPVIRDIYREYEGKEGFGGVRDASEMMLYLLEGQELHYDFFW